MGVSERGRRITLGAIALAGLAISAYLTAERAAGKAPACVLGGGCATVQGSRYADVAGVPVAVLGLLAYAALLLAALLPGTPGRVLGLFTALVGAGFSAWLTGVELGILHAVCSWCAASAVLMVLALAVCAARALWAPAPAGPGAAR
jgi:uncharacterized membrane protein